jgi:tetratricopeptide (TPR) repeat protein
MWVTFAERPMSLQELEACVALVAGGPPLCLEKDLRGQLSQLFTLDRDDGLTAAELIERLDLGQSLDNSRALDGTTWDDSTGNGLQGDDRRFASSNKASTVVNFCHESVREFFRYNASSNMPSGRTPAGYFVGFEPAIAQRHILLTCLEAIICKDENHQEFFDDLLAYAATHWQTHLLQVPPSTVPPQTRSYIALLLCWILREECFIRRWIRPRLPDTPDLFSDEVIRCLQEWLGDEEAFSLLPEHQQRWAETALQQLTGIIRPIGLLFANVWLTDLPLCKSLPAFYVVQAIALMDIDGMTWSDSALSLSDISLEHRIELALDWAALPKTASWHLGLAEIYSAYSQNDKALFHFSEAFRLATDLKEVLMPMGFLNFQLGNIRDALIQWLMFEALANPEYQKTTAYLDLASQSLAESDGSGNLVPAHLVYLDMARPLHKPDARPPSSELELKIIEILISVCYVCMDRKDDQMTFLQKAISHKRADLGETMDFKLELHAIPFLAEQNYHNKILLLMHQMNERKMDNGHDQLLELILLNAVDLQKLAFLADTACRTNTVDFLLGKYDAALEVEAAYGGENVDVALSLQLGRGQLLVRAGRYDAAISLYEDICFSNYLPRPRTIDAWSSQTAAFRDLAALYWGKILDYGVAELGRMAVAIWTSKLEHVAERQRQHVDTFVPPELYGFGSIAAELFLAMFDELQGRLEEARSQFADLLDYNIGILEDGVPENDLFAFQNLMNIFLVAGDEHNCRPLMISCRPLSSKSRRRAREASNRMQSWIRFPWISARRMPLDTLQGAITTELNLPPLSERPLREILTFGNSCWRCNCWPSDDDPIAVCALCLHEFCMECLEVIKAHSTNGYRGGETEYHVCGPDHRWLVVDPLDRDLGPEEILVENEVIRLQDWIKTVKKQWGLPIRRDLMTLDDGRDRGDWEYNQSSGCEEQCGDLEWGTRFCF